MVLTSAESAFSLTPAEMFSKKKSQRLNCCHVCVTRSSIHSPARVNFYEFVRRPQFGNLCARQWLKLVLKSTSNNTRREFKLDVQIVLHRFQRENTSLKIDIQRAACGSQAVVWSLFTIVIHFL